MQTVQALGTLYTAKKLGLNESEFELIKEILGRVPNFTELSIFSVMWSEHCSYKNSIKYLKTLPKKGSRLLVEAGEENAGLVDIGNGLACAFKIESHNHPSAIEPYQGAATGVGGIHRDIFTMGARPIASLNSLRFGPINSPRTKHLIDGVVRGIGDYGNCFGVPTVGGEVYFEDCYHQNILVNAMSVGIVKVGETCSATASGPGNPVFIVGSKTGKDGIHGATFASADLTEDSVEDLPSVQVGDPFQEKLLLEASLEAIQTGAIVGMQDMGAAGITCSTSEMSAKEGVGMVIDLDKVPTRQPGMEPFEILLSESQERMLIVAERGKEHALLDVFEKWDLDCVEIGEVTEGGRLEFFRYGEKVADVPAESLVLGGGAPVYDRSYSEPAYFSGLKNYTAKQFEQPATIQEIAEKIVQLPNIASKRWVFEQYDSMVRTNTMTTNEASDAALVRVKGTDKALAVTTDCNAAYVYADPYVGAMIAVSECVRNIVSSGGTPLAITNCLNFGNPYNEGVYWQFVHVIKGMGEACLKFDTPVTGGNVSFYNQSSIGNEEIPVYPTPTIGMLGLLDNWDMRMTLGFKATEQSIYMIGRLPENANSSEYLRKIVGVKDSKVPDFDLELEAKHARAVGELIKASIVESVHDVSEGGLWVSLLESGFEGGFGFNIDLDFNERLDILLFSESQGRYVVSTDNETQFEQYCLENDLAMARLGRVTDGNIQINGIQFGTISFYKNLYENAISEVLSSE